MVVLPSMPKGGTVGNIVIDGKGVAPRQGSRSDSDEIVAEKVKLFHLFEIHFVYTFCVEF